MMTVYRPDDHPQPSTETTSSKNNRKKLSLENYLAFVRSRSLQNLTARKLNQITSILGFKQLRTLAEVKEAISMVNNPINPVRSTLKENISSNAIVKLDEVIKDLKSLNWRECCVTSIRSINSKNNSNNHFQITPITGTHPAVIPKAKKKTKAKTMPPKIGSISSGDGPTMTVSEEAGSSLSMVAFGSSGDGDETLLTLTKRKRKRKTMNLLCLG